MLDHVRLTEYDGSISRIIDELAPTKDYYPRYAEWLESTAAQGMHDGTRQINILTNDHKTAGITITKNTQTEKKICTLFIHPDYRGEAWGYAMFTHACNILRTTRPVITIPAIILPKYHGLIFAHHWKNTSQIANRYKDGIVEYGFNEH